MRQTIVLRVMADGHGVMAFHDLLGRVLVMEDT